MQNAKTKRCAVYTRKSTDEGLDSAFNSLDAQYDACSAYVRSQIGMGWRLVEKKYDDGGYSGGTMKRPALAELLKDIESGLVDVVVVYKIDRLSRSLCDFTDLSKLFERHGVSFVSVTQQIDTSNAAGRMMLNILMSFAQFERAMTADRIRDKIYASRKRGMWTGGPTPYGYRLVDEQLKVDPDAADAVRMMFRRYAATGSSLQVARELNESSCRRADGRQRRQHSAAYAVQDSFPTKTNSAQLFSSFPRPTSGAPLGRNQGRSSRIRPRSPCVGFLSGRGCGRPALRGADTARSGRLPARCGARGRENGRIRRVLGVRMDGYCRALGFFRWGMAG